MISIQTRRQVWFFAATVTIVALAAAMILSVALYPAEFIGHSMMGTAVIVVGLFLPFALWSAKQVQGAGVLAAQLSHVVTRDRLTNLGTRDYLFAAFRRNPGATGVILLIDVDHFREINDTHGHLIGDEVLKAVAAVLQRDTRGNDLLCRFGGKEFLVFLPNTTTEQAFELAERLRITIEEMAIAAENEEVKTSISIGGALKHRAIGPRGALRQADQALIRAKGQGRNCTIFAATPDISPPAAA